MKKGPRSEAKKMGPLKMAHLNGLSVSRQPMYNDTKDEPERASNDERVGHQHLSRTGNNSVQQLLLLLGLCKVQSFLNGAACCVQYSYPCEDFSIVVINASTFNVAHLKGPMIFVIGFMR